MIVSDLEHIAAQAALTPALEAGFNYLKQVDPARLVEGRYPIDGDRVIAIVAFYETKSAGESVELEGHIRYIDLQYIADGQEIFAWTPASQVPSPLPYNASNDSWVGYLPPEALAWIKLTAGQVAVLYPEDAHAPQYAVGQPAPVKKVVVKVAVP
jgi:biofilm protein TabA